MDAEQRHALKTNELAEALTRLRSWNDPQTIRWLIGLVAVGLLVLAWWMWKDRAANAEAQAWDQLVKVNIRDAATGADALAQLRTLVSSSSDASLGAAARLRLAAALAEKALTDSAQRDSLLKEASDALNWITSSGRTPVGMVAAAKYQLATIGETRGDFDRAKADYTALIEDKRFEGLPFRDLAKSKLDSLDSSRVAVNFAPGSKPPPPPPESQPAPAVIVPPPASAPAVPSIPATPAPATQPAPAPAGAATP